MDLKIKTTKLGSLYAKVVVEGDDPVYEIPGVTTPEGKPVRVRKSEIDSMRERAEQYRKESRYRKPFDDKQGDPR